MSLYTAEDNECQGCELTENLDILRQIDFFSGLPIEKLKVFAYLCNREVFQAGDELFAQGEDDGQAIHILSGSVELVREENGQTRTIKTLHGGDFIGGLSLLSPMPRLYSLKAKQEVVCLLMTREKFAKALAQFPELTPRIFKAVVEGIRAWDKGFLKSDTDNCAACQSWLGISLL
jgi:CRP-like cAMP-binding protein